jgi:hypothetical protein
LVKLLEAWRDVILKVLQRFTNSFCFVNKEVLKRQPTLNHGVLRPAG